MRPLLSPAVLVLLLAAAPSPAQTRPGAPDAAELLAKYRASLGEPDRLASIRNLRCHGKVSWEGLEGSGFLTEVFAGLGRARSTTEFAGFGTFEYGTDGQVVWEKNPLGITIREGWDACQYMREFGLTQHVDWREMYTKARYVGSAQLDGVRCHELQLYPKMLVAATEKVVAQSPPPDVWYLDAVTFLPRRIHAKSVGVFDEPIELRVDLSDWRVVDGVRYPHRAEMEITGFTMIIEYQSFEHNVDLPEGFFDPGEEVRSEVARQQDPKHRQREQEIRIVSLEERHIVAIRVTCTYAQMQKTLAVLLPEATHYALSVGASMTGPPLVRYHQWGETLDIEAAIPVAKPVEPKGRVKSERLAAGKALVAWHFGPYEKLGETHKRMTAFLEANGLERRGAPWEEYWTDPGMEPDPAKWRTKVVWPVREAKIEKDAKPEG